MNEELVCISLGRTVSVLRHLKGWRQNELAKRAGVTNSAISKLERGETNPSLCTILKLTEALEATPEGLFRVFSAGLAAAKTQEAPAGPALLPKRLTGDAISIAVAAEILSAGKEGA